MEFYWICTTDKETDIKHKSFTIHNLSTFLYFCICILLYLYWCTFIGISMKFDYNKMQRGAFPLSCFFKRLFPWGLYFFSVCVFAFVLVHFFHVLETSFHTMVETERGSALFVERLTLNRGTITNNKCWKLEKLFDEIPSYASTTVVAPTVSNMKICDAFLDMKD